MLISRFPSFQLIMMAPREFATLLLLLSVLAVGTQLVNGQQYTTMTNTATSLQTTTVGIGTQTLTTTTGSALTVFSGPFTLPPTHGVCGIYFFHAFNATSGEVLSGTLTMDNQADLYVMTDTAYQAWSHQVVAGGICAPPSPLILQQGKTEYTFSSPVPTTGVYELVVNNLSHSTVNAQLTATLTIPTTAVATITSYSTLTQEVLRTSMQTEQTANASPSNTVVILIAVLLIAIAVIAYVARTRRRHSAGRK